MNNMLRKDLSKIINKSLDELYENDGYLFEANEFRGVCERAIVFRFAYYLQNKIPKNSGYVVDCDFNSNCSKSGKTIENEDKSITKRFIDIIIHKRGNNDYNLCAIECKKWNSKRTEKDLNNLKELTKINGSYKYEFGLYIIFDKQSKKDPETYVNGEIIRG